MREMDSPSTADTVFLRRPDTRELSYIPATVVRSQDDRLDIRLRDECEVAPGTNVLVFFKQDGEFMRRAHSVSGTTAGLDGLVLELSPQEGAEPGELRGSKRVTTIFEGLVAQFGEEENCVVLDVSEAGLALIAGQEHGIGKILDLQMWVGEVCYLGMVTVCSVDREPRRGRFRYGLKCNEDGMSHNLSDSLSTLWVALQVKYLELLPA